MADTTDTPEMTKKTTRKTTESDPAPEVAVVAVQAEEKPFWTLRFTGSQPTVFMDLGGEVAPDQEVVVRSGALAGALLDRGDFQTVG